jgi:hypothetical protein
MPDWFWKLVVVSVAVWWVANCLRRRKWRGATLEEEMERARWAEIERMEEE